MKDYYSILSVGKNATADEIKRAYRRLASQHHPDKGGNTAQFQEIQEAYSVLSDPAKRQQYDNPRPQFGGVGGSAPFDFDAIFDMFGADLRGQRQQRIPRISLWISLADVMTGGPRVVSLQMNNTVSNVEVSIPVGIHDGDTVRYPGLAPGGGDLVVVYRVRPDPKWYQSGKDITVEIVVDIWDLILGCNLTVADLIGNQLSVTVPPETQPNALLRARGRGLPARQLPGDWNKEPSGDMLIRLSARITTPVDSAIKDAIRKSRGQ